MATDTGTPIARPGHGARPAGDRLPVAPRQRRPALIVLAVLLILGGGLVSALLVVRSADKQAVIVLRQDVAEGHVITADDLVRARVSTGGVPFVPWEQRSRVVGSTAGDDLRRGTMLNPRVVSTNPLLGPTERGVGFALKSDQLPAEGLKAGDHVQVICAPSESAPSTAALPKSCTDPVQAVLVESAVVIGNSRTGSDGTITVTLVIREAEAVQASQLGRLNAISLIKLPAGG